MSPLMSIDLTIVLVFLFLTLFIGLGQGKKNKNIKDYALGNRDFSTGALVATIVATWVSGSGFFIGLSNTYSNGIQYVIASSGLALSFVFMAFVLIPRMDKFLGKISVASAMGELYGKNVRMVIALFGVFASTGLIAVQFKVFGNVVSYFLNLPNYQGIIISASIVTFYSAFGGIRAVTFTDVLQIFTLGIAVPIIGVMIWNHAHFNGFIFSEAIQHPKFNPFGITQWSSLQIFSMISLMMYFAIPAMEQPVFQRMSMAKDVKQSKQAFILAAMLILLIPLTIKWVGFLMFNLNPDLDSKNLFGHIIENYTYPGLKGLMIAGVIAMVMSTADSHINSSSVLFAHDICRPLKIPEKYELFISKIFALILGLCAIKLAFGNKNLLDTILTTYGFYQSIAAIPVMLTIMGFRSTTLSISIGMFTGFISILAWELLDIAANGIFVAMIANLVALLGSHYLLRQKGGWIKEKKKYRKPFCRIVTLIEKIKNIDYIDFCKKKAPKNELSYVGFGIHIILFTVTTMYSIEAQFNTFKHSIILVLYQIMMVSGVALCTYPLWPARFNSSLAPKIIWPIMVFTILVLFNTFLVMSGTGSQLQFAMFSINLVITAMLLGWKVGAPLITIGIIVTRMLYYQLGLSDTNNPEFEPPAFLVIYTLMIIWSIVMLFIKPQEDTIENQETQISDFTVRVHDQEKEIDRLGSTAQRILNNVNHELRLPVGNVINFAEMLSTDLEEYNKTGRQKLVDGVLANSRRLSSMILNMLDLMTLDAKKMNLDKTLVNFSELLTKRISACKNMYLKEKNLSIIAKIEEDIQIKIDPNYIKQLIDNLIINSITYSENGKITITLSKNNNTLLFSISDEGKGIAQKDIYDIFTPFRIGQNTETQAEGRGIGLALCKAVVESHGGTITAESDGKNGSTFTFKIPIET